MAGVARPRTRPTLRYLLFWGALALFAAVMAVAAASITNLVAKNRSVEHTLSSLNALERLNAVAAGAEAAGRTALFTGAQGARGELAAAREDIAAAVEDLRTITADNPEQQHAAAALAATLNRRLDLLAAALAGRTIEPAATTALLARLDRLGGEFDVELAAMKAAETRLYETRAAEAERQAGVTLAAIAVGSLLGTALLAAVFLRMTREIVRRRAAQSELAQANLDLGERVAERTAALARAHDELRAIIAASPVGIFMLDRAGKVVLWNKSTERLFGYAESEAVGRPPPYLVPEHEDSFRANMRTVLEGSATGGVLEARRRRKDGALIDVRAHWARLGDDAAQGGLMLVAEDVTERKAAEAARRQSELRLRSILDTVPDAIAVVAADGTIRSFSPAAQRIFGYTEKEIVGRDVATLFVPHAGTAAEDWRAALEARDPILARRKDGEAFPAEAVTRELPLDGGSMLTLFVRDVSERQQTLEHLQQLQAELAHVARLSAMGQMSSTLAHELNQPLTAVVNYLQAARRVISGPPIEGVPLPELIDKATAQALRAGKVIARLREFVAKGESEPSLDDLNALVEESIELARIGAKEAGVAVTTRLAPALPPVFLDRVQIQQVVLNLVRNAVEAAAPCREREVLVATRMGERPRTVALAVADTGSGVDPAIAARVFEPFLTTKKGGMGIGLSICRDIVEAHGGSIAVERNVPTGAIVTVTLPIAEDEEDGDVA